MIWQPPRHVRYRLLWILAMVIVGNEGLAAQQLVTVTVPAAVTFTVTNVSATTNGVPAPATVTATNPILFLPGNKLKISVKADATNFTAPVGSTAIAASKVTWTATASGGNPSNGTLSATTYNEVFRSTGTLSSATVSVTWHLTSIAQAGLRSGSHSLSVRWKFEVF